FYRDGGNGFALVHNGNLTNHEELIDRYGLKRPEQGSDSKVVADLVDQIMTEVVVKNPEKALERALRLVLPQLQGAYSLILIDAHHLIGVRDPDGFRPLCLGRLLEGGWVLASESVAFKAVEAEFVREIEPGEMV